LVADPLANVDDLLGPPSKTDPSGMTRPHSGRL